MKRYIKMIAGTIFCLSVFTAIKADAAWKRDCHGWWYTEGNGYLRNTSRYINGTIYFFDNAGYLRTGWVEDGGAYYYYYSNGIMAKDTNINGYYVNQYGNFVEWISKNDINKYRELAKSQVPQDVFGSDMKEIGVWTVRNFNMPGYNIKIPRAVIFHLVSSDEEGCNDDRCIIDLDTNKVYYADGGYNLFKCNNHQIAFYGYTGD